MPLTVLTYQTVSEDHIAEGTCAHPARCGIAQALAELEAGPVEVHRSRIQVGPYRYVTDSDLRDWMDQYDRGEPVREIGLQLWRDGRRRDAWGLASIYCYGYGSAAGQQEER